MNEEILLEAASFKDNGSIIRKQTINNITIIDFKYNPTKKDSIKNSYGTILEFDSETVEKNVLKTILKRKTTQIIPINKKESIMFVGLGNPKISADLFGIKVCEKINTDNKSRRIFNVTPCVEGITGMKSNNLLDMFYRELKPDVIVIIDSLLTRHAESLNSLIQITCSPPTPVFNRSDYTERCQLYDSKRVYSVGLPSTLTIETNSANNQYDNEPLLLTSVNVEYIIEEFSSVVAEVLNELSE